MKRFEQKPLRGSVIFLGIITILFLIAMLIKARGSVIFSCIYLIMLLALLFISYENPGEMLHNNIFKYRWPLAALLFVVLVAFELSGSSIGVFSSYLNGTQSEYTLFGTSRPIRSDEWAVNTPMALSQYKNLFAYFSDIIRGTTTDTFIVYGQPVLDISVIFRPFHWGYLFLSEGRGLAFFWMGRLIALFMVTLEFAMLLTGRNRKISVAAACLITFAPIVQWWFAVNGLVEMLIFGQLAVLLLDRYMKSDSLKRRVLYATVIAICAGGYILTFYPAWQVPLFYVFAGLALWVILNNWRKGVFSLRDLLPLAVLAVVFGGGMLHIFNNSWDTVKTVMNTAYPGIREETGGGTVSTLFQYVTNLFLPFKDISIPDNPCECAVFFDFFPLGIIMSLLVIFKQKQRDKLLIILLVVLVFLGLYCCVGYPLWLTKITLLNNAQAGRAILAFGIVNILLLVRAMSLFKVKLSLAHAAYAAAGLAVIVLVFVMIKFRVYYDVPAMLPLSALILLITFIIILLSGRVVFQKIFCAVCIFLALIMGATVNPIEKGVGALTDTDLYNAISEIAAEDDGLWIAEGGGLPIINIPMAAGAPTINCTNVYPALERWRLLDESGENEEIYNRYAHILINLTDASEPTFELSWADAFTLTIGGEELETLGVEYIMTANLIEEYQTDEVTFEMIGDYNGYMIYHVTYS